MINLTWYARIVLVVFGVLILVGTFTTPGVQWFASGFGGWVIGIGLVGMVPEFIKTKPQVNVEIHNHPSLPVIDTKEVKWKNGR